MQYIVLNISHSNYKILYNEKIIKDILNLEFLYSEFNKRELL